MMMSPRIEGSFALPALLCATMMSTIGATSSVGRRTVVAAKAMKNMAA